MTRLVNDGIGVPWKWGYQVFLDFGVVVVLSSSRCVALLLFKHQPACNRSSQRPADRQSWASSSRPDVHRDHDHDQRGHRHGQLPVHAEVVSGCCCCCCCCQRLLVPCKRKIGKVTGLEKDHHYGHSIYNFSLSVRREQ